MTFFDEINGVTETPPQTEEAKPTTIEVPPAHLLDGWAAADAGSLAPNNLTSPSSRRTSPAAAPPGASAGPPAADTPRPTPELALDPTVNQATPPAPDTVAAGTEGTVAPPIVTATTASDITPFDFYSAYSPLVVAEVEVPTEDADVRYAADVRDRDVRAAVEAESDYQAIVNEPMTGRFMGSADGFERRVRNARENSEEQWDVVAESFDAEFDAVGDDHAPAFRDELVDSYQDNLDLSEFDPVYHSHILHSAGVGDAPTELDDSSIRTNLAAEGLLEEQERLDALAASEIDTVPVIIDGNLIAPAVTTPSADYVEQQARVDAAEDALVRIATAQERQAARESDAELGRDVYRDQTAIIDSRLNYLGMGADDRLRITGNAMTAARTAEPIDLNESRAQTNAVVWDAIDAENELVEHAAGGTEQPTAEAYDAWLARYVELESRSDAAWDQVYFQSALEVRYYTNDGDADVDAQAVEAYTAGIHERAFPEIYRPKIGTFTNKPPLSDNFFASSEDIAQEYIERAESAYEEGGTDALLDELEVMSDDLMHDPYVIGDDTFAPDNVESNRRLAEVQAVIAEDVQPLYIVLANNLDEDLQTILDDRDRTNRSHETDLAVATRLERTVAVLPRDMASHAVIDTHEIWADSLATTTAEPEIGYAGYDNGPKRLNATETYAAYARISDIVVENADGGEEAFTLISDVIYENIRDSENESTPYYHSVQAAAAEGDGYYLAVETVNRLSADESTHTDADVIMDGLVNGSDQFIERLEDDVESWSGNREEYDRLMSDSYNFINSRNGTDLLQPGYIDATELDIEAASTEYLENNPEMMAEDERLMLEILDHGNSVFALELASAQLSDEAIEVAGGDRLQNRVEEFVGHHPLAAVLADNPLPMATVNDQIADLIRSGELDPAELDFSSDQALLETFASFANDNLSVPRNLRFLIGEWSKTTLDGRNPPIPGDIPDKLVYRWSGPGLFAIASAATGYESIVNPNGADGWDRTVDGLRSANYAFLSARDSIMLASNHYLIKNAALRAANNAPVTNGVVGWLTRPSLMGLTTDDNLLSRDMAGRIHSYGPRAAFLAFDAYNIISTREDGLIDANRVSQGLSTTGSIFMLAQSFIRPESIPNASRGVFIRAPTILGGRMLPAAWGGPVAWAGTALWVGGALAAHQADRISESNRFETADARLFFSHFGSHDPATGELREITDETEVTPFTDHLDRTNLGITTINDDEIITSRTDHPDWSAGELGALPGNLYETEDGDRYIVYRGISANAVDELMNNSSSPDNPVTASTLLDALATRNGLDTRTVTLDWFDEDLNAEQQKALPPAAFGVDVDSQAGVQPEFFDIYQYDELASRIIMERDDEASPVSADAAGNTLDYVNEYLSIESEDHQFVEMDRDAVMGALGYGELVDGQAPPSPEVAEALTNIWFGGEDHYRYALSPTNMAEFEVWLDVKGYPELPDGAGDTLAARPMHPAADTDFDYRPVDHYYTVTENDSIWNIAGRTLSPTEMQDVIAYHNLNTTPPPEQFDPERADSDFFTPHDFADLSRDPDLIHPGDVIFVRDANAVSDPESEVADS